jgi:hypothetical protein
MLPVRTTCVSGWPFTSPAYAGGSDTDSTIRIRNSTAASLRLCRWYTLVYNGLALKVSPSSVAAIKAMSEVKSVKPNTTLHPNLNNSVKYIHAPQVYGAVLELSQFDDVREA